jgi:P27 family predicted phage terminase small subunit
MPGNKNSGRRREPTELKLLKGETRPSRVNEHEPKPPPTPKTPSAPAFLSDEGKKAWRRLAPTLHRRGVLTDWDIDALAITVELLRMHREATELLDAGMIVPGRTGGLVTNPAWRIVRDTAALFRSYAQEFGLTPSARSAITLADEEDPDGHIRALLS